MACEVSFAHEGSDHALFERRCAGAAVENCAAKRLNEFLGQDQITKPQAGKENFAEAARIEDAIRAVEAL